MRGKKETKTVKNEAKQWPTSEILLTLRKSDNFYAYAAYLAMLTYGVFRIATAKTRDSILFLMMLITAILFLPP